MKLYVSSFVIRFSCFFRISRFASGNRKVRIDMESARCFDRSRVNALRRMPKKRVRGITLYNRSALNASLRLDFFSAKSFRESQNVFSRLARSSLSIQNGCNVYLTGCIQIFQLTVLVFS